MIEQSLKINIPDSLISRENSPLGVSILSKVEQTAILEIVSLLESDEFATLVEL